MIKKIMVPIAFSPYAGGILDCAAELAEVTGAMMHIVNVINQRDLEAVSKIASFGYKVDSEKYVEVVKDERRAKISELTSTLNLPDERVAFTFLMGDPTTELLRFVVERDIDLVVMGVQTRDITNVFAGSVAERMFRRCPVPLVSFRGDDIAKRLRTRVRKHISAD